MYGRFMFPLQKGNMNIQVLLQAALPLPETAIALKPMGPGNSQNSRVVALSLPEVADRAVVLVREIQASSITVMETGDLYVPHPNKQVLEQALTTNLEHVTGASRFELSRESASLRAPAIAQEPYQHAIQENYRDRNAETLPFLTPQAGSFTAPGKTSAANPETPLSRTNRGSFAWSDNSGKQLPKPDYTTSSIARYLLLFCFLFLLVMIINRAGATAGGSSNQSTFFTAR